MKLSASRLTGSKGLKIAPVSASDRDKEGKGQKPNINIEQPLEALLFIMAY